jgi:hypothetical protein
MSHNETLKYQLFETPNVGICYFFHNTDNWKWEKRSGPTIFRFNVYVLQNVKTLEYRSMRTFYEDI